MWKKLPFLFLFLFFFYTLQSSAAGSERDSLQRIVDNAENDSLKVDAMISVAKTYFSSNPEAAIRISSEAKALAEKSGYTRGVALALKNSGLAYYKQSKYVEALSDWEQSKNIFENIGDKKGVANMLSNMSVIYKDKANYNKALELLLESQKVAEEIKDSVRIMTVLLNIGSIHGEKKFTYKEAIEDYQKALPYAEALQDQDAYGTITGNLGEIYLKSDNDTLALINLEKSLKAFEGTENVPYTLNLIGQVYNKRREYEKALDYQKQSYDLAKQLDSKLDIAKALIGMAATYKDKGNFKTAVETYHAAEKLASNPDLDLQLELKEIYEGLADCFSSIKDYTSAFHYQNLLIEIKDKLFNIDVEKKLGTQLFTYQIEKKQGEINLQQKEISKQKIVRNSFVGGFAIVALFAGVFFTQRNRISKEKKRSDELLLNILPEETAEELKATGTAKAKSFDSITVMFTDFKNFTQAAEKLSAEELVQEINHCYSEFDKIITRHGIEKIKTIGDAYMCAGGLPVTNSTHPVDVIKAGLEMQEFILKNKTERIAIDQPYFELRLGIHTGPVVAGIVGIKKFAYDIWGDTVNTASRMESSGEIGKVNISGETYELVKDKFTCIHRGKVKAKNKGEIDMYFVSN